MGIIRTQFFRFLDAVQNPKHFSSFLTEPSKLQTYLSVFQKIGYSDQHLKYEIGAMDYLVRNSDYGLNLLTIIGHMGNIIFVWYSSHDLNQP